MTARRRRWLKLRREGFAELVQLVVVIAIITRIVVAQGAPEGVPKADGTKSTVFMCCDSMFHPAVFAKAKLTGMTLRHNRLQVPAFAFASANDWGRPRIRFFDIPRVLPPVLLMTSRRRL